MYSFPTTEIYACFSIWYQLAIVVCGLEKVDADRLKAHILPCCVIGLIDRNPLKRDRPVLTTNFHAIQCTPLVSERTCWKYIYVHKHQRKFIDSVPIF